jgi:hypothetical protein
MCRGAGHERGALDLIRGTKINAAFPPASRLKAVAIV